MLKENLELVKKKLLNLLILENDITYIGDTEAEYFERAVSESHFLYRCYRNSIQLFTIDLCKILNRKENGNMFSLVEEYIHEHDQLKWHHEISIEELNSLKYRLTVIVKSEEFKRLKTARDKYYAHDDVDKGDYQTNVKFEKIWAISKELQTIFNRLNYCHLNTTQWFEFVHKPLELEIISRYRQIRDVVYDEYKKTSEIGELRKVLNIVNGTTV